jgi:RNA polymerase sigma factor (sigma-70 family)
VQPFRPGGVLLDMVHDRGDEPATVDETAEALGLALVADLDSGFAGVVRSYERIVYSVALQLTGRATEAEDLAAEAFLRAYRALRGYDEGRIRSLRLRPWLLTIVRNTARNIARDASRRPGPPPGVEPAERPAAGPSVEQHVEGLEVQRQLDALLSQLPDPQRLAVVLRHVAGLPTAEVAEALGCPEGTAKSHVSRGLQRLRALLSERCNGGPTTRSRSKAIRRALSSGKELR